MADTLTLDRPAQPMAPTLPARTFHIGLGAAAPAGPTGGVGASTSSSAIVMRRWIDAAPEALAWIDARSQAPHDLTVVVRDGAGVVTARWELRGAMVASVVRSLGGGIDELVLHCECIDVVPASGAPIVASPFADRRRARRAAGAGRAEAGSVGVRRPG